MIKDFNLKEAFNYTFRDPQGRKNFLVLVGLNAVIVCFFLNAILVLLIPFLGMILFCIFYFVIIIGSYLYDFYTSGYFYHIVEKVMHDKKPDNLFDNPKEKFIEGIKLYFIQLIIGLIMIPLILVEIFGYIIVLVLFQTLFVNVINLEVRLSSVLTILIILAFSFVMRFIVSFVRSAIIYPTVYHYLVSNRQLESVFKLSEVFDRIKLMFKSFLKLTIVVTAVSIIEILIVLPFILIIIIAQNSIVGLIMTILVFIILIPIVIFNIGFNYITVPHLIGQIFRKYL